jgi:hypothetical protein
MKKLAIALILLALPLFGQTAPASDPFKDLAFLRGPWEANVQGGEITSRGTYTFKPELDNHILSRKSVNKASCKDPADFDCEHSDLLYVYVDAPGAPLKAIYFDNGGHVIHYNVTTPTPTTAVFLSDGSQPGPVFRITYELKGAIMAGKFQMQMPGQTDWKSYLEWSGGRK